MSEPVQPQMHPLQVVAVAKEQTFIIVKLGNGQILNIAPDWLVATHRSKGKPVKATLLNNEDLLIAYDSRPPKPITKNTTG